MPKSEPMAACTLMPLMRYRDVGVASEWLSAAFGCETHFAAKAPDGQVFYAELRFGNSMIMLGAVGEPGLDALMRQPDDAGSAQTQSCYVVVPETEAHYERAKRAGAVIVLDLKQDDKGGRGYSCRDPEGHVWNFGTYDPWSAQGATASRKLRSAAAKSTSRGLRAAIVVTLVGSVVSGWWMYDHLRGALTSINIRESLLRGRPDAQSPTSSNSLSTGTIGRQSDDAAKEELSRANAAMNALKRDLERERHARQQAIDAAAAAKAEAARTTIDLTRRLQAETERSNAERQQRAASGTMSASGKSLEQDLTRAKNDRELATQTARDAEDALTRERNAKDAALRAIATAQEEITRERSAKEQALKTAGEAEGKIATAEAANTSLRRDAENLRDRLARLEAENPPAEAEPSTAKSAAAKPAQRPLKRISNLSSARKKLKKQNAKQQQNWPFSSW